MQVLFTPQSISNPQFSRLTKSVVASEVASPDLIEEDDFVDDNWPMKELSLISTDESLDAINAEDLYDYSAE